HRYDFLCVYSNGRYRNNVIRKFA
ncbi:hypothetical protein TNCT_128481, partial [Trichonephila clavata]